MHIKDKDSWIKHTDVILIDELILVITFSVSYALKFHELAWWARSEWSILLLAICLLDLLITVLTNTYSNYLKRNVFDDLIKQFILTTSNVAIACFFFYLLKIGELFSREMLIETYGIYFVLGYFIKWLNKKYLLKKVKNNKKPLYVVCSKGKEKEVVANSLASDIEKYEVVGVTSKTDFIKDVLKKNAREVLIALQPNEVSKETYETLVANGIGIHLNIESMLGIQTESQYISSVGNYKTLGIGLFTFSSKQIVYLFIKRIFDIICGLVGLLVLIPLIIIIKIITLCSGDTKSIFYRQERIGKDGKHIKIFKFRSMVYNADEVLKELLKDKKLAKEWKKNQKFDNDPRITKIGNFLRKTSLDELPQLLNVLVGDMSLVGPRPLVEGELEEHDGLKLYTLVKPGITGWWGCNGRSNIEYRERLELEYYYVRNCSFSLDVLCILRTIYVVLAKKGSK